jgi:CRISPR-associated endoribonuclease Cas6
MLTAVVLMLKPIRDSVIKVSHGESAHALALKIIGNLNPDLERDIHARADNKPLTVSPVWEAPRDGNMFSLRSDKTYRWRLTGLNESVSECLLRFDSNVQPLRLDDATFKIVSFFADNDSDQNAGQSSYKNMLDYWNDIEPPKTFTLKFLSPTTFRDGSVEKPFPMPELVFGSLINTWNAHSPYELSFSKSDIKDLILLSNWRGETRSIILEGQNIPCFTGKFTYQAIENISEIRRLIGLLSDYAFFAGVGWQTTRGLGQAQVITTPR